MWANTSKYAYKEGDLFLGIDKGNYIGISTERHAITIAGAGAGKGACVIIPNLLRWKANALVIDPKGEAVNATAQARQEMGQRVHVLDPFNCCPNWEEKATYNPLDAIDPNGLTAREDIGVLADGIVMRGKDGTAEHWDKGASDLIAGVIAVVCLTQPPELRNLITVRHIISDKNLLEETMQEAKSMNGCGNLPQNGASAYFAQEGGYFISNAEKNTNWLDSPVIQSVFQSSSFALSELKNGDATIYLVLPANYLVEHGRFLRLFVRSSIDAMQKQANNGSLRNKQCLFLLDEFFALGYISEIATSAGLMRGYGLQLWPILQDIGQLVTLYGREGAGTFFGNADLHQFFGNTDNDTLNLISELSGTFTADELGNAPIAVSGGGVVSGIGSMIGSSKMEGGRAVGGTLSALSGVTGALNATSHNAAMAKHQKAMTKLNRPRLSPDEVASLVERQADVVAKNIINYCFGRTRILVKPAPFFRDDGSGKILPASERNIVQRLWSWTRTNGMTGAIASLTISALINGFGTVVYGQNFDLIFLLAGTWFVYMFLAVLDRMLPDED